LAIWGPSVKFAPRIGPTGRARARLQRRIGVAVMDLLDPAEYLRVQGYLCAVDVLPELLQAGRPDDGAGGEPALAHERQREGCRG